MNPVDNTKPTPAPFPTGTENQLLRSTMFPGMLPAMPATEVAADKAPSLAALLGALRRRWLVAVTAALLAATLGVLAVLVILPVRYTAQATVQIDSSKIGFVMKQGQIDEIEFTTFKQTIAARIKSPMVLKAALESPKVQALGTVQASSAAIKSLESMLKTDFLIGPEILRITLSGDDPQEVATLLNAVVDAFLSENRQKDMERRNLTINSLEESRANTENALRQKKTLFRKILAESKLPDIKQMEQDYANTQQRFNIFKKELLLAEIDVSGAQEELKNMTEKERRLPNLQIPDHMMVPEFEKYSEDQLLSKRIAELTIEYQELQRLSPNGQVLDGKRAQIRGMQEQRKKLRDSLRPEIEKKLRETIADVVRGEVIKSQEKLVTARKRLELFENAVKGAEEEVRRANPTNLRWPAYVEAMHEEITGMGLTVAKMRETIEFLKAEPPPAPRVREWYPAEVPTGMDMSRQVKFGGVAGLGLFCVTLFGIAFLELRSGRISSVEEVTSGLGMRVIGTLPPVPVLARQGLLKGGEETKGESLWQNKLTEAVDAIRTVLVHAARTENVRVVMVSSAGIGEGKTSLASQLAASLARAWRNTLLIDGDLRHPATHKLFGLPLEPGFSEVLRGEAQPADAIKPTPLGRLWLMPAGHFDNHAVQALAQDNVKTLFEALKQQYEFIIVDSSPVLPVADSLSLGQNVDGVVYAVLRDVSRFPALQAAQQRMASLNIRTLGAVLIGSSNESGDQGFQYTMSRGTAK